MITVYDQRARIDSATVTDGEFSMSASSLGDGLTDDVERSFTLEPNSWQADGQVRMQNFRSTWSEPALKEPVGVLYRVAP